MVSSSSDALRCWSSPFTGQSSPSFVEQFHPSASQMNLARASWFSSSSPKNSRNRLPVRSSNFKIGHRQEKARELRKDSKANKCIADSINKIYTHCSQIESATYFVQKRTWRLISPNTPAEDKAVTSAFRCPSLRWNPPGSTWPEWITWPLCWLGKIPMRIHVVHVEYVDLDSWTFCITCSRKIDSDQERWPL